VSADKTSSRRTELINKYSLYPLFLSSGFVPFEPVFDSGIDFILYREADGIGLNIQQKAVWTVNRKYFNKNIWMLFGDHKGTSRQYWYLAPHDFMVQTALREYGHNPSMKKPVSGGWDTDMSKALMKEFESFKLPAFLKEFDTKQLLEFNKKSQVDWP
jgi:hypothetical protein